ncbi:MAG: hypothetical protein ABI611_05600 [Solirubrobacteraceae bacterium]|jgi:hypothetical protein
MSKRSSGAKSKSSNPAIPTALANKLAARSEKKEQQRAAATPPKGGGQTRRPIRHQGR